MSRIFKKLIQTIFFARILIVSMKEENFQGPYSALFTDVTPILHIVSLLAGMGAKKCTWENGRKCVIFEKMVFGSNLL